MGILLGAAIGIAIGAATLGASAASGTAVPGQTIALSHIPSTAHGYAVVDTVKDSLIGGAGGGAIGAAVAAVAKVFGGATPGP